MKFKGTVKKGSKYWLVEVPALDVMTQGETRREALEMIADAIEILVDKPGFKVEVHAQSEETIEVESNDINLLNALFIQRNSQILADRSPDEGIRISREESIKLAKSNREFIESRLRDEVERDIEEDV